jgi:hypothetical protein
MVQITVTVDYNGKFYQTNVLTHREAAQEEIFKQALSQVKKQWKK